MNDTLPVLPVVAVRELQMMRGGRTVIRRVSFDVLPGEICALMGVSGAGKSTVLRAIAALEPIGAGTVQVRDVELRAGPLPPESHLRALRGKVGMVFQAHSLFEHPSVLENVTLAPIHTLGWTAARANEVAAELLASLGVGAGVAAFPRQLSGGEAQRVAVARALALDPLLLLMDEPTSALDPARRTSLGETLRALARQGRGLLVATHDVDFARAHADRVLVLADGELVEQGSADAVLSRPAHRGTRALLQGEGSASNAST